MDKTYSTNCGNLEAPHTIIWTFKDHQNNNQQLQNSQEKQQETMPTKMVSTHTLKGCRIKSLKGEEEEEIIMKARS